MVSRYPLNEWDVVTRPQTRSVSVAAPLSEPLTLAEAKKHLEIANAVTVHDDHITALIQAAREVWEHDTQQITVSRVVTENFNRVGTEIDLSLRPVQSVTSVTYDGETQTGYSLDPNRRIIEMVDGFSGGDWNSVIVIYVAGFATVPEIHKSAMKLQLDLMFQPEKQIRFHNDAYERLVRRYMRASYP